MIKEILVILVGIYLGIMAVVDRRKQAIPVIPSILCLMCVVVGQIVNHDSCADWLPGILPGLALYGISKATQGAIGEGDALIYMLTGVVFGFGKNMELLIYSLLLCSVVSIFLLVLKKVKKKDRLPFVPFTAVVYGMVVLL